MTYDLFIGDRSFSSWSLRGWLMFEKFGLPVRIRTVSLYTGTMETDLAEEWPARLVPVIRTPEGMVVGDSLAIAETLAERHPDRRFWPQDPAARALARWLVAEMHSGFAALRSECPMMIRHAWTGFSPSEAVRSDLERISNLWAEARTRYGRSESPWLFGDYSLADVFYAPVATRITTYGLACGRCRRGLCGSASRRSGLSSLARGCLGRQLDQVASVPYRLDLEEADWPALPH